MLLMHGVDQEGKMSFSKEDSELLKKLLDTYGFKIKSNEAEEFVLYQEVKIADSLSEILQWIIVEFEEK
jgi:hypothetical protein